MKLDKREPSGREKDEASAKLLEELRQKLYSERIPAARRAAFNLAWMQEDGFEILTEAIFSNAAKSTKRAAVYGLRKMQGRMKKVARQFLEDGLGSERKDVRDICKHAKAVLEQKPPAKRKGCKHKPKFKIREISHTSPRERGLDPNGNRRHRPGFAGGRGRGR